MLIAAGTLSAEPLPDYYSRYGFLVAPPASFGDGLVGYVNPANLALLKASEAKFYWSTDGLDASSFHNWGLFFGAPYLGFGVQRLKFGSLRVTDYKISTGMGNDGLALGLGYGWSSGDSDALGRERLLTGGAIIRPIKYLSLGLIGNLSLESSAREAVAEIGIRPLGTSRLTLFADGALRKGMEFNDAPWSAGAVAEIVPGISLAGRYFKDKSFTAGITVNLGRTGVGGQGHYDSRQHISHYTYSVRAGGLRPSVFTMIGQKRRNYLAVNLKGKVDYLKYAWFDNETISFMAILKNIRAAADDPRVGTIALNLSGTRILPEHAWEIREELAAARLAGKKVIIFFDEAGMTGYHLASVADKIVMDPQGNLQLGGFAMGNTYFKGLLDKLGLGFDEWRFFKYKSTNEVFSRDMMSDADREQYQDYVDDWYNLVKNDICYSRRISREEYDRLINEQAYFMPDIAVQSGLVDTLARWSDIGAVIKNLTGVKMRGIAAIELRKNALSPQEWGIRPQVAIVYGLGECALDSGIRARWLERVFRGLARKKSVRAVVFRVDSPGGDPMASDIVAEALKKCAEKKPVIVSQGQVAGSGGYWISMYGNNIVAGPNTVTGSIGVIGGWLYDKGFGDKIGLSSDLVKHGEHADLGFGIRIPFLNFTVPSRNLTPEERTKMESLIRKYYDIFVEKVAAGRKLPVDDVRKIAEGHFYSGTAGKDIKLIDEIGGIMTALALAENKAGLKPNQEIEILEIPRAKGLINLNKLFSPISFGIEKEPAYLYLKMTSDHAGRPLPMMLPGSYPTLK